MILLYFRVLFNSRFQYFFLYFFQASIKNKEEKFQTSAFIDALWDMVKTDTYCHDSVNSSLTNNMVYPLPHPASEYEHLGQMFDYYGEPISNL